MDTDFTSTITTRNDMIEYIRKWVAIDSQLKIVNEKTKKIRELKNSLTQNICNYAQNNSLKDKKISISDGTLSFNVKKDYSPLTYSYIEKCLGELISDKKQVEFIIEYIKNNRDIKTSYEIKRTYDKKLQIDN